MPDYYTAEARHALTRIMNRTGETRTDVVNRALVALDKAETEAQDDE